jgi:hypothetical protein
VHRFAIFPAFHLPPAFDPVTDFCECDYEHGLALIRGSRRRKHPQSDSLAGASCR